MTTMTPDFRTEPEPPRRSSAWLSVVMAFALFAGGVGVGWLFTEPAAVEDAPSTTVAEVVVVDDVAPAPETVVETAPPTTDPLVPMNAEEPIADVAEALLPSIVQIELPQAGVGSGVIYSSDGLILTAAHVVDGFTEVVVVLSDGERLFGEVVGLDVGNDIAVISIDRDDLQAAPLALDSVPRVGQMAIALGSPWGLDSTVTAGIISAVQALPSREDRIARLMLQTDASINPGNSGGPLATRDGRVVGINVSIFSSSGANDGGGFAVPIDRADRLATSLVNGEDYASGFLGVSVSPTEDGSPGALITVINPGTAAEEYGLQIGDQVVAVNGIPVKDATELGALISDRQAGEVVVLRLLRSGDELTLEVILGQRELS